MLQPVRSYIGVGSNLQNPSAQVREAITCISALPVTALVKQSALYESEPMGPPDQANYINAVVEIETTLSPLALLGKLNDIEEAFGRDRSVGHWGPRVIDLDILLYGQRELDLVRLRIPHPGLEQRAFVVLPLVEIAPQLVLPNGRELRQIAARFEPNSVKMR